jgi:hypothetical protein
MSKKKTEEELKIEAAVAAAKEFIRRAEGTARQLANGAYGALVIRAAMRRQSMELTRALAYLRRR